MSEYRPARLNEIIGHVAVRRRLRVLLTAAKRRKRPLPHIIFAGPPGLGKTTFALALGAETAAEVQHTQADGLSADTIRTLLRNIKAGTILFIDEIHRIKPASAEIFYSALEDQQIADGGSMIQIAPFTAIGATTHVGMMSEPFRRRFRHVMQLDFLRPNDLATIAWHAAWTVGVAIEPGACWIIGTRAKGTPRRAVHVTNWVIDYALARGAKGELGHIDPKKRPMVTTETAKRAVNDHAIDERGLDTLDRKYLSALSSKFHNGPVGIKPLASCLGEAEITLEQEIEPWLVRRGFIALTAQGRVRIVNPKRKKQ